MISKTQSYSTSDGTIHATLEKAQIHELVGALDGSVELTSQGAPALARTTDLLEAIAKTIVQKKDQVLDILSTGPRSIPRARKINGGRKKRGANAQTDMVNAKLLT